MESLIATFARMQTGLHDDRLTFLHVMFMKICLRQMQKALTTQIPLENIPIKKKIYSLITGTSIDYA